MRDDLDPLSTLYARFDAITKELAQRRVAVSRRTARTRLPVSHERPSRLNVLEADVARSLQRVCPMMPAQELERLAAYVAATEMAHEEGAMASSAVHMLEHGEDAIAVPSSNGGDPLSGHSAT
jgi:hypothetical protein